MPCIASLDAYARLRKGICIGIAVTAGRKPCLLARQSSSSRSHPVLSNSPDDMADDWSGETHDGLCW